MAGARGRTVRRNLMNVTITTQEGKTLVNVNLSERNLLTLLSGLDPSACFRGLSRTIGHDLQLSVMSETDASHYANRRPVRVRPREDQWLDDGEDVHSALQEA